jgi:hypothetical protein
MKKSIVVLGCLGMVTVLSGCPIWIDTDHVDEPGCDWGCSVECYDNTDCGAGYLCDDTGICIPDGTCYDNTDCGAGYICNVNGVCVPDDVGPTYCYNDVDCLDGYCEFVDGGSGGIGTCVETGPCTVAEDCVAYGPGLTCDDRGICVPDEGPCPDGQCGCVDDTECADGQLCIDSLCTDLSTVCIFDFECGDGSCIDNKCHAACDTEGNCPTGQGCVAEYCMDLAVGTDGCVFDEDCGETGFRCINATCHATCTTADECGDAEACTAGACRADTAPIHECTEAGAECADGMSCIRGTCRMPCAAPVNCADQGVMTECVDGFCVAVAELDPTCVRVDDCASDASCFNGQCMFTSN